MKTLSFTKDSTGWYIDLPEWTGDKGDLAMVAGADDLLDCLDFGGTNHVKLDISLEPVKGHTLYLKEFTPSAGGAIYTVEGDIRFPKEIWLCAVTEYVFGGKMPRTIYFNKI